MNRMERIKKRLFEKEYFEKKIWWGDDESILTSDEIKSQPLIIRKARAIRYVAQNMPISLKPDELIVGQPTMASVGFGKTFPKYTLPEEDAEAAKYGFTPKSVPGHHLLNYESVLKKGLSGVRREVMARMAGDVDQETAEFLRAVLISIEALKDLAVRYTDLVLEAAATEKDATRKRELLEIAKVCTKVPENPPETFHEALQSVWFTFVLCHSTLEFIPVGRSDQYLYPYYKKDIESGRITREYAAELAGSFMAKFGERIFVDMPEWELHMRDEDTQFNGVDTSRVNTAGSYSNDESYNYGTSANHWLCNMILGGVTPEGRDATNELTYLLLDQWAFLETVSPIMSVRLSSKSPEELYRKCADILRNGASEPALYNDDLIIRGFIEAGFPIEDARDYSNDGCWECIIPGKTNFGFCMLQVLQLLEYLLQDGKSLVRGAKEADCIPGLETYKSFDDFYKEFMRLLRENLHKEILNRTRNIPHRAAIAPSPFLSAFMDDCIERGKEYSVGGARYHIFGTYLTGFANCIDSLAVIKKLVFEEGKYSLSEIAEATRVNFEGYEPMRQYAINHVPKYGNDEAYVDTLAKRVLDDFSEIIKEEQKDNTGNMILGPGIATFEFFAKWGHDVGASADGRKSQEPVASNISPAQGADMQGPTAAIKSTTAADLLPYFTGGPLDMEIDPGEVKGEQGLVRMVSLIKGFIDLGGMMLTITGVSRDKLIEAQKNPEMHRSLRVRMGGLSAYFVTLSKEMQNSIIERTSHIV